MRDRQYIFESTWKRMAYNANLNVTRSAKNDEFYTRVMI